MSPIDPLMSSANTMPTASGCSALSRHSRARTPFGFIFACTSPFAKTCDAVWLARADVMAWCAS